MELKSEEYYSQKISEYLDGELDSLETGELFKEISNNPTLQDELKEQIHLRSLFQQELLPPPKESRFVLLGKLNLQRSAAIIGLIATFFSEIKKVIFNPAFGAAIFGVALFIFGYFFTQNVKENDNNASKIEKQILSENTDTKNNDLRQQNSNQNMQKLGANTENNRVKQNKPKITNLTINNSLNNQENKIKLEKKQVVGNNNYQDLTLTNTSNAPHNQEQLSQVTYEFREIPTANFSKDLFKLNLSYDYSRKSDVNYFDFSFLDRMSLSIVKSANYSNVQTNLEPLTNPLLNNYSLSLAYNFDKNNSISLEYGQENYPQKYSGYVNGIAANINQIYTAQWFGISYQYNLDLPKENLLVNPYVKVLGSATKIGPLFKSSMGLAYHLNDKLLITAGVEGSILIYQFQNQSYNTKKYGFFYGARLNF